MAEILPDVRRRVTPDPTGDRLPSKPIRLTALPTSRLLEWHELPQWQQEDSSYVQTGYRRATPSFLHCLWSWRYLHNESVNIFSHLFGAGLFYALPHYLQTHLGSRYAVADYGDAAVFTIYLIGVAGCYTLSVLFHTLMSHSARGFTFGIQLDFQGIILLIWSASAPLAYYTFHQEIALRRIYLFMITLFAILASIITFTPAFHKPSTKPLRAGVFGSLALSTLLCVFHGLWAHGWVEQTARFPMQAVGATLFFNTLGATVYVLRFPERWWPRTFDIFGASHQLMHFSIMLASLTWLLGMIWAFDNVHAAG